MTMLLRAVGSALICAVLFGMLACGGGATRTTQAVTTPPPSPPSPPQSVQHSVKLAWTASPTPGITGYNVYRGAATGGPYTKVNTAPVTDTNYTDASVASGQTYFYQVTAVASDGAESTPTSPVQAVIPSP